LIFFNRYWLEVAHDNGRSIKVSVNTIVSGKVIINVGQLIFLPKCIIYISWYLRSFRMLRYSTVCSIDPQDKSFRSFIQMPRQIPRLPAPLWTKLACALSLHLNDHRDPILFDVCVAAGEESFDSIWAVGQYHDFCTAFRFGAGPFNVSQPSTVPRGLFWFYLSKKGLLFSAKLRGGWSRSNSRHKGLWRECLIGASNPVIKIF